MTPYCFGDQSAKKDFFV
ncbi:rCG50583 [Rattus norvegicus]|uniref:RCG50583 n=1 Tax=Rattus norvegicus TaxID=10116 RepID=A6KCD1_RAT|nr:rCG50583 [Rattus norvegicus]